MAGTHHRLAKRKPWGGGDACGRGACGRTRPLGSCAEVPVTSAHEPGEMQARAARVCVYKVRPSTVKYGRDQVRDWVGDTRDNLAVKGKTCAGAGGGGDQSEALKGGS